MENKGKLYIIPTPIGNLKDITYRAIEILSSVDIIYAEDTRVSLKLLNHYSIKTVLKSYHKYNEHGKIKQIIEELISGKTIAIISDAGTPGISDPGFLIIREAINNNIEVDCLPGSTALIPALVVSGFPLDRFIFEGFLPQKGRKTRIQQIANNDCTTVIYESPHRLLKLLKELHEYIGNNRRICVCREISKFIKLFIEVVSEIIKELEKVIHKRRDSCCFRKTYVIKY